MSEHSCDINEEDDDEQLDPSFGMRVRVLTREEDKPLGYGTYVDDVHVDVTPDGTIVSNLEGFKGTRQIEMPSGAGAKELAQTGFFAPKVVMENGDIIYGFQCHWEPVPEPSVQYH